ncbi:MAG: M20/M25/M40 family metallo-hydrolase [Proteobacteria bacterium]|nr:M20/M25/M40 family metallo-hydrolase [Desulfocapsa sp.]MBU3943267.1 M20/M25/M40 family metallo-hydrolase [Pseudomonadota bacterium]MCG2744381.1 M20/M25/M40 family metallo-hydrolase [Desulfobacteraceae bacterium]MBU3984522.1 M20/M25/M40 family metallo-hydrolase [Pseudomonadota bacterium]MBU4027760.1 M20/M25/M40 family metallo-hydrolase [Pseudomonadota bacterium]
MKILINQERLAHTFVQLCETDSPSRKEKGVSDYLTRTFQDLGATSIVEDNSAQQTGSDCGNLIISFPGNRSDQETIFFACHMDTVEPGCGVEVVQTGDIFTSRGDTVLGSDDKSGIAALIELIRILQENRIAHGPLELLFTTCEEIGLLGAKALDCTRLKAGYGYALDSTGIDRIITGAPAANKLRIEVHGIAAHAGLHPEQGISALCLTANAITKLRLGRLDEESTANFGLIHGGVATNIIPDHITIEGEVRSHSLQKLAAHTAEIQRTFQQVIECWPFPPSLAPTALEHPCPSPFPPSLAPTALEHPCPSPFPPVALQPSMERATLGHPCSASQAPTPLEPLCPSPLPPSPRNENETQALDFSPSVTINVQLEYPAMRLELSDPVLARVKEAGINLGRTLEFQVAGGGSDANIFNSFGLPTAIIATGMDKVHTTDECLDLKDLIRLTELLFAIVVA